MHTSITFPCNSLNLIVRTIILPLANTTYLKAENRILGLRAGTPPLLFFLERS
jgi:hypothetical protein